MLIPKPRLGCPREQVFTKLYSLGCPLQASFATFGQGDPILPAFRATRIQGNARWAVFITHGVRASVVTGSLFYRTDGYARRCRHTLGITCSLAGMFGPVVHCPLALSALLGIYSAAEGRGRTTPSAGPAGQTLAIFPGVFQAWYIAGFQTTFGTFLHAPGPSQEVPWFVETRFPRRRATFSGFFDGMFSESAKPGHAQTPHKSHNFKHSGDRSFERGHFTSYECHTLCRV